MRQVRPALIELAFQPGNAASDLGTLLVERGNNMRITIDIWSLSAQRASSRQS
jgi:hypothetical protein